MRKSLKGQPEETPYRRPNYCHLKAVAYRIETVTTRSQNKTENQLNSIHKHLTFNGTEDKNSQINYLDLTMRRDKKDLTIDIYRKPNDVTIHFTSNNPMEHKLAAYQYMFHRAYILPSQNRQEQRNRKPSSK